MSTPMRQSGMQVAVIELEPMGQRGLEIAVERGFQQMAPERRVSLEPLVRKNLLHERLGRTVMLVADADAYRRQVADEEVDPVIRRDDDEQVGPARLEPPSDLVESGRQPVAVGGGMVSQSRAMIGPWLAANTPTRSAMGTLSLRSWRACKRAMNSASGMPRIWK